MKVLAATKAPQVFDTLNQSKDIEILPALYTGRIYAAISDVDLAIVDYDGLVPHPFSSEAVRRLLENAPLELCSSDQFLDEPDRYLSAIKHRQRRHALPAKKTVAFTSYSGGTGKTSLALDTAFHFASQTKALQPLPVAAIEFTYGASALDALVREPQPDIYELLTQPELEPYNFHGVSLYPMNYGAVRNLPQDQVGRFLNHRIADNVLTVIDTIWPHGLVNSIGESVDLWIVLTTPRIDAVENARRLRDELSTQYGEDKVILVANQMGGLGTALALMGLDRDLELKQLSQSEVFFGGRLGKLILSKLYNPVWQDYENAGRRRWRLFKR